MIFFRLKLVAFSSIFFFFFNDTATTEIYTLSLHDALPISRDDIRCVLDALGLQRAHVVGLSMGAFATLHFGMTYGYRALSITVAGGGYGSHPAQYRQFQADSKKNAELLKREGMKKFVAAYGHGPQRVQLEVKDPRGF